MGGGVFLERFSVVFDYKEGRLGIALAGDQESEEMIEARTLAAYNRANAKEGIPWVNNLAFAAVGLGGVYAVWAFVKKVGRRKNFQNRVTNANDGESSDEVAGGPEDIALV